MNRRERRRQEREGNKVKKPKMVHEDIIHREVQKEIDTIRREAKLEIIRDMFKIFALTLNNALGFGKKRINKFLARVMLQYECLGAEELTGDDLDQFCKDKEINVL